MLGSMNEKLAYKILLAIVILMGLALVFGNAAYINSHG